MTLRNHSPTTGTVARRAQRAVPSVLLAALMAALMAACGPGTGGSGDGESALASFGATAAPLCGSSLVASLDCLPAGTANPAPTGTSMVFYSDTAAGNNIAVRVQGNSLELSARCLGLQFDGQWGIAAQNDARFFGTYTSPAAPRPALASLTVGMGANGQELFVLLRNIDGRVLIPATVLRRVGAPVANPAACPG